MADEEKYMPDGQVEEEDDVDDSAYIAQKDAVLFAIDVSKSMLQPPPASDSKAEKDTATLAALKCAYQIMQQRIISQPKDMMGVLLFGTEQSKFQDENPSSHGGLAYSHCYLLSDLEVPAASDVKALKALVEDEAEAESLLVPSSEPVNMSNMLFCANQIFTTKAPNFGSRRLFIITDRDDPHEGDKHIRSSAVVRAKDLYDLGVIIELFPISKPDHEFDRTKFYDDIIYRDPTDPDSPATSSKAAKASGGDGISLLQSLISNINSKQVAKRALFSNLPFEIGPDFKISVKGFNVLHQQKPARSCYVWLDGEKAQIVSRETTQMAEDTSRTISKIEIKKAYKFGGDSQVLFTSEEQKALKDFGPPGIRVIGFKPQSLLPPWASVHKSTFVYPSEEDYVGSTRVFSALQQKLLKDKKMGLAWYIARVNASPMLVAILPGEEKLDEDGSQSMPAGLWLYPLPYADDLRYPPEIPHHLISSNELVDNMRIVIRQLQLPKAEYNPAKYPNPSLQWHYKILQALALEEEIPEEPEDKTVPRFKQINKRAGAYVHDWGAMLEAEYCSWVRNRPSSYASVTGTKRNADGKSEGVRKKIKNEESVDMKGLAKAGKVSSLKIAELKDWLATMGLDTTGRKDALVERIEGHFE